MASEKRKVVEFALLVALVVLAVEKKLRLLVAAAVVESEEADSVMTAMENFELVMLLSFDLKVVENAAAAMDEPAAVVDVTFVAAAEDALVELVDVAEDELEERLAVDEEDETAEAKNVGAVVETDDVVAADVEVVKAVEAAELEIVLHDIAEDEQVGVAVV
jgi:hypothetical protein